MQPGSIAAYREAGAFDEGPRVRFARSRHVRATRKPHRCAICGGLIPAGSEARYDAVFTDEDDRPIFGWSHADWTICAGLERGDVAGDLDGIPY